MGDKSGVDGTQILGSDTSVASSTLVFENTIARDDLVDTSVGNADLVVGRCLVKLDED